MTKHLLQIHIGPMQTFIAAARRTRDLWFGSWLMSELSKAAARSIVQAEGEDSLIFPAATLSELKPGSPYSVSNKISAVVSSPAEAAENARKALETRFQQLVDTVNLEKILASEAAKRASSQLNSFLEYYWVSVPLDTDRPEAERYRYARKLAEALLAARKNTRSFRQVDWSGTGLPKSSLNGRMETVTPQPPDNNQDIQAREQYAQMMYQQFKARPSEQLSGVDLLKRLGKGVDDDQDRFPSTSHMAAMPLKAKLNKAASTPAANVAWQAYLQSLPTDVKHQEIIYLSETLRLPVLDNLDGALLFESRLLDFMEKSETVTPKKKLAAFLHAAGIDTILPYYALLVADGDSIGAHINKLKTAKAHRTFSQKLALFAQEAKEIVENGDGAVVYAGGDDVMALLPLHTAVATTAKLAAAFKAQMIDPTFSAGIAIVHHLEPLEDGLALAREAEKTAKALPGKDALAITLNKRSGAPRTVAGRWGQLDDRLLRFAAWHKAGDIPDGLAYQLRDVYVRLGGDKALLPVYVQEAKRIIGRKRRDDGEEMVTDSVQDGLVAAVTAVEGDIEQFSSELIIAAHIAQAQAQLVEEEAI